MRKLETCSSWPSASFKADIKYRQSWIKVLRQFSKTILYLNENIFFICSHPLPPKQCCKTLFGCLFVSNIEKGGGEGEATFHKFKPRKKVGNFHVSQQLLSMTGGNKVLWYQNVWFRSEQWISHWSDPFKLNITSDFKLLVY